MGEFMQLVSYIDSHNINGIWAWVKIHTGDICVFAVMYALVLAIVRRMRG